MEFTKWANPTYMSHLQDNAVDGKWFKSHLKVYFCCIWLRVGRHSRERSTRPLHLTASSRQLTRADHHQWREPSQGAEREADHQLEVGGLAWFLGWVFEFSSGVAFSIAINVKNMKITYFLDLMQYPRLAPPKTGQNWQKWENSNCLYIFGDFFALFLPDFQNVGTQIFRKASSFQKKFKNFLRRR